MRTLSLSTILALSGGIAAQVQEHQATAGYQTTDAPGFLWVSGFNDDSTVQQLIIDASLLTPMVGKTISSLSFRRDVADRAPQRGGRAAFEVHISSSRSTVREPSESLVLNQGANRSRVFAGQLSLPNSPTYAGGNIWSSSNTVKVPFSFGYPYGGGDLCLEFTSSANNSFVSGSWAVDAVFSQLAGSCVSVSHSVSKMIPVIDPRGFRVTSGALERDLVAGGTAVFFARGTPNANAIFFIGVRFLPQPLNLASLNSPQSNLLVEPIASMMTAFPPLSTPELVPFGEDAVVTLKLPADRSILGAVLTAQWVEYDLSTPEFLTSNAVMAQVAPALPAVMLSLVTAHKGPQGQLPVTGKVDVGIGHVVKFEYQ